MIRRFLARLFRPAPAPITPALYASWYVKLSLEHGDTIKVKTPARFEGEK